MSKATLRLLLIPAGVIVLVTALCVWLMVRGLSGGGVVAGGYAELGPVTFVGREGCVECHQDQYNDWHGSHHDKAMDHANDETVLGDFNDTTFANYGVTSRFYRKQNGEIQEFWVNTEGPDGTMQDYRIDFVFGVEPLQQYLIEFPGGRYQCLPIAWDTRAVEAGGQRWFHMYPDERIAHDDPLFWAGPLQNWNYMCGQCHTTDYTLGYDADTDTFNTTYNEIDVSCEACHGPGSRHEVWARKGRSRQLGEDIGMMTDMRALEDNDAQINTCIVCHSRRSLIADHYQHGDTIENHFVPEILRETLYHADGQIQDEVYVYGSFAQSEMYHHQNVKCSDCHNPHSLDLIADGNALCVRCHIPNEEHPDGFDTVKHHFHEMGTPGASCVECHMPETVYMVVDPRRDHSMRVPRPDLSVELGGPNACTMCHEDQTDQWAADAVVNWHGSERPGNLGEPNQARVFAAARRGEPSAEADLITMVSDNNRTPIVRATAIYELRQYPSEQATQAILKMLKADSFWLRYYAAGGMNRVSFDRQALALAPLLKDPSRAVRSEAARVLSAGGAAMLPPDIKADYDAAVAEYEDTQKVIANQPGGRLNLAVLYGNQNKPEKAREQYLIALKKDPTFVPALMNLATVANQAGSNQEAETYLRKVIDFQPEYAEGWYSLGLLLAEEGDLNGSTESLGKAAELAPSDIRMLRNYAVALHQSRRLPEALRAYQNAVEAAPNDAQSLNHLATFYTQLGYPEHALPLVERLRKLTPTDQAVLQFEMQLRTMVQQKQASSP